MSGFSQFWKKLAKSKKYREEFVSAQVKRGIPFQIRRLMKQKRLSQQELAVRAGLTQGVVSRAADPEYGNLTLNTIIRVAAGFDVAFIGRFVPFSDLGHWFLNLSEEAEIKTFDQENREFSFGTGAEEEAQPQPPQEIPSDAIVHAELVNRNTRRPPQSAFGLRSGAAENAMVVRA